MFQATRCRLALWYTTMTAVLLLFFATGVYCYVRTTLIERIDDTLNHVVEVVERSLVFDSLQTSNPKHREFHINLEASFRDNADAVEDDHIDLEWFSPTGELLWSTLSEPLNIPLHSNRTGETVRITHHYGHNNTCKEILLRQVTDRVQIGRQVLGYLRVSHPWFEVTKPSRQLTVDLSLGILFMVSAVAAIGWFLSGIAIQPVRESFYRLKQFTADASHELRSPIATIQTNVQAALADGEAEPQYRQQLQVIERLTRRMGRLVEDLLFLARQDSGIIQQQWQAVPLDELLIEVMEEQQLLAKTKGVCLSLEFNDLGTAVNSNAELFQVESSEDAFILQGDRDQLTRLFTNLVTNALQHTPKEGKIGLTLQPLLSKNHHRALQVTVQDTGKGIPPEALPHLFDRFYRVDPARTHDPSGGSGLGLAIAQAIVLNHKGNIQIKSEVNQGTTVTVTLPLLA